MEAYPCPRCGGRAEEPIGCQRCGRPHDPQAAELARLNQLLAHDGPQPGNESRAEELRTGLRLALAIEEPPGVPHQRTPEEAMPETVRPADGAGRNAMLILGGVLLGIPGVVVTVLSFGAASVGGQAAILAAGTLVLLVVSLLLARRTLDATAETLAAVGLVAVVLDGYLAHSVDLVGLKSTDLNIYSCLLFALVAAIAAGYRLASHLRAPQFAALLAVQPVLPLLAVYRHADRDGLAVVLAVVAALNLASVELLASDPGRALRWLRLPGVAPGPGAAPWPPRLRELAWVLFSATLAGAGGLAAAGLAQATSAVQAWRSGAVLLLAAAIGVVGGLLARRRPVGQIFGGLATFALIVAAARVVGFAAPDLALVLTGAVAATAALGCALLPRRARTGPRWGSLLGALVPAGIVLSTVVRAAVEAVRASTWPGLWRGEVAEFGDRVRLAAEGWSGAPGWQVPAVVLLLALVGMTAAPARWRLDAFVVGLGALMLASLATGAVPWWAAGPLAWAASTVAVITALVAPSAHSAILRGTTFVLLALFGVATSLGQRDQTALVAGLVTLVVAVTVLVARPSRRRRWAYAVRVADAAAGVGVLTLPVAVGSGCAVLGARAELLVPATLLATAFGVEAAALGRVAARVRSAPGSGFSGTAIGALLAAGGAMVLAVWLRTQLPPADLGVAGLLVLSAVIAVNALPPAIRVGTAPASDAAPVAGLSTIAAALATAGLALALSRLGAVLLPGIGLVVTTATVLLVALGIVALPGAWRTGPRLGGVAVGAGAVAIAAGVALVEAGRTVAATWPYWLVEVDEWPARASAIHWYGWAVPVSLLLAALAALGLLPRRFGVDGFLLLVSLAGLSLPAVLASPWWSAPLVAGVLATVAGVVAARGQVGHHPPRLGLAAVLVVYAVAAGSVSPSGTATVLVGVMAAGLLVTAVGGAREDGPPSVPGLAMAAVLLVAPGAAACTAIAAGVGRGGTLGIALGACAVGVGVVTLLHLNRVYWAGFPGVGAAAAALGIAIGAMATDRVHSPIWAAACALFATVAAGHSRARTDDGTANARATPAVVATVGATAVPIALFAAVLSARAWVAVLIGPFQTLGDVWGGRPEPIFEPDAPLTALFTLLLLTPTSAGIALILGGRRYLLAAVLPPLAAAAVVLPGVMGSPEVVAWVFLGVALAAGLGAALSRPDQPGPGPDNAQGAPRVKQSATRWLRRTAGIVCLLAGGAGFAGSLATRTTTLVGMGVLGAGALVAALLGRDPLVRGVSWGILAGASLALPPVALLAFGTPAAKPGLLAPLQLRPAAFMMLAVCGVLVGLAWALSRRPGRWLDTVVLESAAALGAAGSLVFVVGSSPHTATALTIIGVLLGLAALRADRDARVRVWLVWSGLAAMLGACWLLLAGFHIGLPEAYTLPFAVAALLAGAAEQGRRPAMSSWLAYGPGLAGTFLPSMWLVLMGEGDEYRWAAVLAGAVLIVIVGSTRRRPALVITGAAIAVIVAIIEMIWLISRNQTNRAILVGVAGAVLIVFGAISERRSRRRDPDEPDEPWDFEDESTVD